MTGVLQTITDAAVEATGAVHAWLLVHEGNQLRVVAAAGDAAASVLGRTMPANDGTAGLVVASGQPLSVTVHPGDPDADGGVSALLGRCPVAVLAVPCGDDAAVHGALERVDKADGSAFSFDELEMVSLFGLIAGAVLQGDADATAPVPPAPAVLARDLDRLASSDPARYAAVAGVIGALLSAHG